MAKILRTTLPEIGTPEQFEKALKEHEKLIVVCGRNGPMCLPVYGALEVMREKDKYKDIGMYVMPFDLPVANAIRRLPEVQGFMGLPFTIYYRNGKVVKATSSIQDAKQIKAIFAEVFA
ncbi:MAG: thioredoxin [Promethearchaeota archaeon]